jgi:GntR family transcriptional regulator
MGLGDVVLAPSRPPVALGAVSEHFVAVDPDLAPFQQIMDQFRSLIERGELRLGDALPTVRQLAGDLGVAPNTVARAYAELKAEGLLTGEGRRGTRVTAGVPGNHKPSRTRKLQKSVADFISTLERHGYSETEIAAALRRSVR